jgi:hypothetical protein
MGAAEVRMPLYAVTSMETVVHVLWEAMGLATAIKHAVAFGHTDIAATIVEGILGYQLEDVASPNYL